MPICSAMIRVCGGRPGAARWPVLCALVVPACSSEDDGEAAAEVVLARSGDFYPPPYTVPGRWTFPDPVCGGDVRLTELFEIEAPQPPQDYHLSCCDPESPPCADTICVSDAAELETAAHLPTKKTIILEDGYYLGADLVQDSFLRLGAGHRLWAENSGKAILTFGVIVGSPNADVARYGGAEFHGLVFDINDPQYGAPIDTCGVKKGGLVNWGDARDLRIEDCWFRGWEAVHTGIHAAQPNGLQIARTEVFNFLRFGIFAELPPGPAIADRAEITDVAVRNIGDETWHGKPIAACPTPACVGPDLDPYCPGTAEHGIWLGETATLERARVRNAASAGVIAGDAVKRIADVQIFDVDVDVAGWNPDVTGAGVAFERGNDHPEVRRFCIGRDVPRGIHAEWDHGDSLTRSTGIHVADGFTKTSKVGVYFDAGATDNLVENVLIMGASWSALGFHNNYLSGGGSTANTTVWCDLATSNQPTGSCEVTFSSYNVPVALCQNPNHPSC